MTQTASLRRKQAPNAAVVLQLREYRGLEEVSLPEPTARSVTAPAAANGAENGSSVTAAAAAPASVDSKTESRSSTAKLIDSMPEPADRCTFATFSLPSLTNVQASLPSYHVIRQFAVP